MTHLRPDPPPQTETAIVGGGLTGLALADALHRAGADFQLFEARPRLGGRITTLDHGGARFDLGPSWFWPGQPRMAAMVRRFGLTAFEQAASGDGLFQDASGAVQRGRGVASMAGALRLDGGLTALIAALSQAVPPDRVHSGTPVTRLHQTGQIELATGRSCTARRVVLCLPPRVAATLAFAPALPPAVLHALNAVPTWMAGHAKVLAVYDQPFWRAAGLSGDAASRLGPLAEIHDASARSGAPAALFGFVGVPAAQRAGQATALKAAALAQLAGLFGPAAASPRATALQDWATAPETATPRDAAPLMAHPAYGPLPALAGLWDGALTVCSTETAPASGGLMEGALEAAHAAAARISGVP